MPDLVEFGIAGLEDPQRRVVSASVGDVRLVCAYVPNGQSLDSEKYQYKLGWLKSFTGWLREELAKNILRWRCWAISTSRPRIRDVHDPKAWEGQVLCQRAGTRGIPGHC